MEALLFLFPGLVLVLMITGTIVPRFTVRNVERELDRAEQERERLESVARSIQTEMAKSYNNQLISARAARKATGFSELLDPVVHYNEPEPDLVIEEANKAIERAEEALREAVASPVIIPVVRKSKAEIAPPALPQRRVGLPDGYRPRRWLYDHHLMPSRWFFRWLDRAEEAQCSGS